MKNKVFELVLEIKNNYISKFGEITYDKGEYKSCVELWIDKLQNPLYEEMFSLIETSQNKNLILLRYGNYTDVFSAEIDLIEFYHLYDGLYKECRSIVIDVENEKIVILPFDKFFNINEVEETKIDNIRDIILNAEYIDFTDKMDGSMQTATYYNNQYIMAGSKSIDPEKSWRLADGYSLLNEDYKKALREFYDFTFIFEYISEEDAHVVIYEEDKKGLYLIGIRNNLNGQFFNYNQLLQVANEFNLKITKKHSLTLDEVLETLPKYKSSEKEGYVMHAVVNNKDYFVKIKCNDYVAMHSILSMMSSPNLLIRNIANGNFDDFYSKVPEAHRKKILDLAKYIFKYIRDLNRITIETSEVCKKYSSDLKEQMIWITNNVDKEFQHSVRTYIKKGELLNHLKNGKDGYINRILET